MNNIAKKIAPSALVLALTSIFVNVLWGTPFPLVKVMYEEMNLLPELLGDNYNGQVLTAISLRFFSCRNYDVNDGCLHETKYLCCYQKAVDRCHINGISEYNGGLLLL